MNCLAVLVVGGAVIVGLVLLAASPPLFALYVLGCALFGGWFSLAVESYSIYRVEGAWRNNGNAGCKQFFAKSEEDAIAKANKIGLMVSDVTKISRDSAEGADKQ